VNMRTIYILCLALMIALSFGCSKKKEEAPKPEATGQQDKRMMRVSIVDKVSNEEVLEIPSPYVYEYKNCRYQFNSAENMKAFMADPEKYLNAPQGQQ